MRISELLNLRRTDIQFFASHITVFIEKSKTDIYRDGSWLVIAKTGNLLCPVKNLKLFLLIDLSSAFFSLSLRYLYFDQKYLKRGNK